MQLSMVNINMMGQFNNVHCHNLSVSVLFRSCSPYSNITVCVSCIASCELVLVVDMAVHICSFV